MHTSLVFMKPIVHGGLNRRHSHATPARSAGMAWPAALARSASLSARAAGHAIPEDLVGVAWEWRRFNPPWTIGFLKTNEVCIPL